MKKLIISAFALIIFLPNNAQEKIDLNNTGIEITDPNGPAEVRIKGFEGQNANLRLIADEGDDNGDTELDYTRFYFKDGLNLSLDPGYDAGHFNQEASLMSRLLEEDEGVGFTINAMGLENANDAVIPLVVYRESGSDFRISIDTFGIDADTNVYLEDNENGTMTLLNEEDFELTTQNSLNGAGRFFVHLTEDTFSNEELAETSLLNVFKLDRNNFITIEGLATGANQTSLRLYNILGKQVVSTVLSNNTNTQRVSTKGLAAGVYIIKLESGNKLLTKKLIIK